jgi:ABC-type antimicrobial peptide transport system permease subunit
LVVCHLAKKPNPGVRVILFTASKRRRIRVLASFLFGVDARDVATFATVSVALVAAACSANYVPARRATRVDPIRALRHE